MVLSKERAWQLGFFLLPGLVTVGPYLKIGPLMGYRILLLILAVASVPMFVRQLRTSRTMQLASAFSVVWMGIGAVLLVLVARQRGQGVLALVTLGFALLCLVLVMLHASSRRRWDALLIGLLAAIGLNVVVGFGEIVTGRHLERWMAGVPEYARAQLPPSSPGTFFANINDLAAFLALSLPLVATWLWDRRTRWAKAFLTFLVCAVFVVMFFAASRLALLAYGLVVSLLGLAVRRENRAVAVAGLALAVLAAVPALKPGLVVLGRPPESAPTTAVSGKSASPVPQAGFGVGAKADSSSVRIQTYKGALWIATWSKGLGSGPGQFTAVMRDRHLPTPKNVVPNPHNMVLEVLTEYGLLPLLAVLGGLALTLVRGAVGWWRRHSLGYAAGVVTLLALVPCSMASSTYLYLLSSVLPVIMAVALVLRREPRHERELAAGDRPELAGSHIAYDE